MNVFSLGTCVPRLSANTATKPSCRNPLSFTIGYRAVCELGFVAQMGQSVIPQTPERGDDATIRGLVVISPSIVLAVRKTRLEIPIRDPSD